MTEQQRRTQIQFPSSIDGFDVHSSEGFSHVGWQDVAQVKEIRDYFLIKLNRYRQLIVPIRGFHQLSDVDAFRGLARTQLGAKAKLRS